MKAAGMRKVLELAGLTRHEATVLLSLARLGAVTAREVARASGVNRVQTYRALDGLEGRGLVEVTLDRPRRFVARAIEEVFDSILEERRVELENLERIRRDAASTWPALTGRKDRRDVRLQIIKGRTQVYRAIRRLVAGARNEILAFTTTKGVQRSYREGVSGLVASALQRGVTCRLLADIHEGNATLMTRVAGRVPLRHMDRQRGRFIVADRESVLAFLVQDEATIRGDAETALWTNGLDFVRVYLDIFEALWHSAMPANQRLQAINRGQGRRSA